jgi:hypothetical protein
VTADRAPADATVMDGLFVIARAIDSLAIAVTRVSHGDANGPTGLEMLSMAITGEGARGHDSLAQAIRSGSGEIAQAVQDGQP